MTDATKHIRELLVVVQRNEPDLSEMIAVPPADAARAALLHELPALLDKAGKYDELLYAVQNKVPGESRHESALRCITQWETSQRNEPEQAND